MRLPVLLAFVGSAAADITPGEPLPPAGYAARRMADRAGRSTATAGK